MTDEKWEDLKNNIRDKFEVLEESSKPDVMTDDLGNEIEGTKDTVVFKGPMGKMKVERTIRPVILGKKSHYNKTQAGKALIEYIVSDTETTSKVSASVWDEISADWNELDTRGEGKISF